MFILNNDQKLSQLKVAVFVAETLKGYIFTINSNQINLCLKHVQKQTEKKSNKIVIWKTLR